MEYRQLETKVEILTKRLRGRGANITIDESTETPETLTQQEVSRLLAENEDLRRENEMLRNGICRSATSLSSSVDSESDSSTSTCSSSSSSDESVNKNNDVKEEVPLIEPDNNSPQPKSPNVV